MAQDVAFVARFYSPPGSGRSSEYALYRCELDGTRRRRIRAVEPGASVAWVDDRTLAISAKDGREIVLLDRSGKTLRTLSTAKVGWPEFSSVDTEGLYVGTQTFRRKVTRTGYGPPERTPSLEDFTYGRYRWEGKDLVPPKVENADIHALRARRDGQGHFLIAGWLGASAGETVWIWDMPAGVRLSTGLTSPQLDPHRRLYWGTTPGRLLTAYGTKGRRVFTSQAYVERLGVTSPKPIVGGLVFVSSVAVRPRGSAR